MKKLKSSTGAKLAAAALLCVLVLVFIASFADIVYIDQWDAYSGSYENAYAQAVYGTARDVAYRYADTVIYDRGVVPPSNLAITIEEGDEVIFDNYNGEKVEWTETFDAYKTEWPDLTSPGDASIEAVDASPVQQVYKVTARLKSELKYRDKIYNVKVLFGTGYYLRYTAIWAVFGSFVLGVALYVFLLSAAGHRRESGEICGTAVEKIPYDIFTVLIISGIAICAVPIGAGFRISVPMVTLSVFLLLAAGLFFLWWSMSTAIRAKTGTIWKNTLIWKILRFVLDVLKKGVRAVRELVRELPLTSRGILIAAAVLLADFVMFRLNRYSPGTLTFLWFVEKLVLTAAAAYLLWCAVKLRNAARAVANGDMNASVDTSRMIGELKAHGEDINNIRGGMTKAVEERIRSERFRSELVTNVSHDIKTPLTSIINYVDLMEKEQPENEKMREYLEVIDRQSARLKKLIDDLMEASKASTGNLTVSLERCELGVLIDQTAGEYQERLGAKDLELVTKKPGEPVTVMADGRHMWRIFDNLMNNILKYAQNGTRVYLTLDTEGSDAVLTFRNISRARLELSGEELTERFVRGDTSRNSEGSGLGLSIAKSLAELQHGTLDIFVDGDLFKVVLRLPTVR